MRFGEVFARARNGEAFFVEQALDFENGFDVFAAVKAMAGGSLHRLQRGNFLLPITQDECFGTRQAAYLADAEELLVWWIDSCWGGAGHLSGIVGFFLASFNPVRGPDSARRALELCCDPNFLPSAAKAALIFLLLRHG